MCKCDVGKTEKSFIGKMVDLNNTLPCLELALQMAYMRNNTNITTAADYTARPGSQLPTHTLRDQLVKVQTKVIMSKIDRCDSFCCQRWM